MGGNRKIERCYRFAGLRITEDGDACCQSNQQRKYRDTCQQQDLRPIGAIKFGIGQVGGCHERQNNALYGYPPVNKTPGFEARRFLACKFPAASWLWVLRRQQRRSALPPQLSFC